MPPPVNTTAGTAIAFGSLPFSTTQNVHDAGTTYDVWYKYTAVSGDTEINVFGFGDLITYRPSITAYSDAGITVYLVSGIENLPVQLPVVPGSTYWFKFATNIGNPTPAVLTLTSQLGPDDAFTGGDLLINDDTPGFPGVIVSGTTGEPIKFVYPFPEGESGDNLSNGVLLMADDFSGQLTLFDADLNVITTIVASVSVIRAQRTQNLFYIGGNAASSIVRTVDESGAIGATTWTLTGNPTLWGMAANNDGSILYFANAVSGSALKRWDLIGNVALSDLVGPTTLPPYFIRDILVLPDDTLLASYVQVVFGTVTVRHYNSAGTLLASYGPYSTHIPFGTQPRMAYDQNESDSFWLLTHLVTGHSVFRRIQVSTGAVLDTLTTREYETGVYEGLPTATPDAYFGVSFSCPLVVLIGGSPAPSVAYEVRIPRRLRRAPHLAHEQQWRTHWKFQIDLKTGIGLDGDPTQVGADPKLMLHWSDDGGHTWSNEHWRSAGRIGNGRHRALWRQLGRTRDRVYEVVVSDPVKWQIVAAYLDTSEGTN